MSPGAASCSALVLPLALGASKPCAPRGFRAVRAPDLVPGARSSPRLKSGPPRWVASDCQTSCPTCNSQVGFVSPCVAMPVWGTAPARQHMNALGACTHAHKGVWFIDCLRGDCLCAGREGVLQVDSVAKRMKLPGDMSGSAALLNDDTTRSLMREFDFWTEDENARFSTAISLATACACTHTHSNAHARRLTHVLTDDRERKQIQMQIQI